MNSGTSLGADADISPSASSLSSALASNQKLIFSPKTLRPISQAASTSSGTLSTGVVLYTDIPVKAALEEAVKRRKSTVKGRPAAKRKLTLKKVRIQKQNKPKRGKRVKQRRVSNFDSSDDEPETYCLVCMEHFNNSQPREVWIQCGLCHLWAYKKCTPDVKLVYICHNCDSGDRGWWTTKQFVFETFIWVFFAIRLI